MRPSEVLEQMMKQAPMHPVVPGDFPESGRARVLPEALPI